MKRGLIALTGIACLSAVTVLLAASMDPEPTKDLQTAKNLEMAEDLEIMGAVLRTELAEAYASAEPCRGVAGSLLLQASGEPSCAQCHEAHHAQLGLQRPEAAYLEGYGAVYQLELDVPPPEETRADAPATDGPRRRGPTAWESALKQLGGERPQQASQKAEVAEASYRMPTKDDLVEKLLEVLAENAGNFRHLKPEDRFTVAITFPRTRPPRAVSGGADPASPILGEELMRAGIGPRTAGARDAHELLLAVTEGTLGAEASGGRSSHEVSGDLYMRQENYQKAVEAYQNVLKVEPEHLRKPAIARKLIQAYVAAGDLENAQKWIDLLKKEHPDGPSGKTAASGQPGPRAIPLPARLVVSVPKARLDEAAAGKMTREELDKCATVDYFHPPADRPGLGSASTRASYGYMGTSAGYTEGRSYDGGGYGGRSRGDGQYGRYAPGPAPPGNVQGTGR
jgi:tetratricopeptide (TPR) repeat protein